jgi:hypothetical protein
MSWRLVHIGEILVREIYIVREVRNGKWPTRGNKHLKRYAPHDTAKQTGVGASGIPDILKIKYPAYLADKSIIGIDCAKDRAVHKLHHGHTSPPLSAT